MANETVNSPEPEKTPVPAKPGSRKSAVTFVVVFIISVFAMLIGYRYSVNTMANIWYIFQVGNHTAWSLDKIGYSCKIEESFRDSDNPDAIRAKIAAWKRGETPPQSTTNPSSNESNEDSAPAEKSLSPWERWQFRALEMRSRNMSLSDQGPFVHFIWKASEAQYAKDERIPKEGVELPKQNIEFRFRVVPDCGAIPSTAIFCAAILAFPTRWWRKLFGIAIGVPILYGVNIFRLTCLGVVGAYTNGGQWFDFAHKFVWQGLYIVFVVAVWMAWVEFVVRRKES